MYAWRRSLDDRHRARAVVQRVLRRRSDEEARETRQASRAHEHHGNVVALDKVHDRCARVADLHQRLEALA